MVGTISVRYDMLLLIVRLFLSFPRFAFLQMFFNENRFARGLSKALKSHPDSIKLAQRGDSLVSRAYLIFSFTRTFAL